MKQIIPWLGGIALLFFCALPASAWTIRATLEAESLSYPDPVYNYYIKAHVYQSA